VSELKRFQVFSKDSSKIEEALNTNGLTKEPYRDLYLPNKPLPENSKLECRIVNFTNSTGFEVALLTESKFEWDWLEKFKESLNKIFEKFSPY